MAEDEKKPRGCPFHGQDIIIPGPMLPNGHRLGIRHTANHEPELGEIVSSEEGRPMPDNAHLLTKEDGVIRVGPSVEELKAGSGPAQVATPAYRDSWDRVFGKQTVGQA
jgi:hypothetical protein